MLYYYPIYHEIRVTLFPSVFSFSIHSLRASLGQRALQLHDLAEPLLQRGHGLGGRRDARPPRQAPVAVEGVQRALDGDEAAPDGDPVGAGHDGLGPLRLRDVARVVELHDVHARAGREVGQPRDDALPARDERLQREVGGAAQGDEAGLGGGRDAGQLARVGAGQLDADDVGVL